MSGGRRLVFCLQCFGLQNLGPRIGGSLCRLVHAPRLAVEAGALLDDQGFVEDFAFDLCGVLQHDLFGADHALDLAADDHLVGNDVAVDRCVSADDQLRAANVAVELAVDLHIALAVQIACDDQAGIDDGPGRWAARHAQSRVRLISRPMRLVLQGSGVGDCSSGFLLFNRMLARSRLRRIIFSDTQPSEEEMKYI